MANIYKLICTSGGYFIFGRIHMMDFGLGRPTHPCTKILCSNPSMYQFFCSKPIQLSIFIQFSLSNPSMYQKIMLKSLQNPSMYRNFTIFLKMTDHVCTFLFQNPSMYIENIYPWKYVSTPPGPIWYIS